MRISLISIPLLFVLVLPASAQTQAGMPLIRSAEPASGKPGDVLTVQGENLSQDDVAALYLTDGTIDIKVAILEQTSTSIRFRIPSQAKPGRFAPMVLTSRNKDQKLIEQPVKITIEPGTVT